ncbi:MAG: hypothetical protein ABR579_03340, partial [Actinomycetota bacterium]
MKGRSLVALLMTLALVFAASGARAVSPAQSSQSSISAATAPMRRAVFRLSPKTRLLWRRLAALPTDKPQTFYWTQRVHDLDSDGAPELLVMRIRIAWDYPLGFGFTGTSHFDVLSGRTGKRMWSRDDSFTDGYPIVPIGANVGPDAAPGLIDGAVDFVSAGWTDTFVGLSGDGTVLWSQTLRSSYTFAASFVAVNAPVTVQRLARDPDQATDLLIGQSEYAAVGGETRVSIIDGSDGSISPYPVVVASTETVPIPYAAGNLDRQSGEDFVVTTDGPNDNGAVEAFSGIDGSQLWTTQTDLGAGSSYVDLAHNLTGNQEPDLVLAYLSSGNNYRYTVLH